MKTIENSPYVLNGVLVFEGTRVPMNYYHPFTSIKYMESKGSIITF